MSAASWRALVVDDEPPVRAELSYLLEQDTRIGRVEEAANATEAIEKILASKPDVLFLDIQMPGTSGMKLAQTLSGLKNPPIVVFVTAFSEYAADAYQVDAVDYVLKPVETERLHKALDKVGTALGARKSQGASEQVQRLLVERAGKRAFIPVSDIAFIEANADSARAVCPSGTYAVNESISSLDARLTPQGFLRVHRSYLVSIDRVRDIEVDKASGLMELSMEGADARVPVSRRRTPQVKEALGLQ